MKTFESFSAEHRAAFSVEALVVQGEMWLTVGERVQHLRAGERYGAEGAIFWVDRRNRR